MLPDTRYSSLPQYYEIRINSEWISIRQFGDNTGVTTEQITQQIVENNRSFNQLIPILNKIQKLNSQIIVLLLQ